MSQRFDSKSFNKMVAGRRVVKKRLRKTPRMLHPMTAEREYKRKLLSVVSELKSLTDAKLLTRLPYLVQLVDSHRPNSKIKTDALADDMDEVRRLIASIKVEYERKYTEDELYNMAMKAGVDTSRFNKDQIKKVFNTVLGVDPTIAEPWLVDQLETWATANVSLITSISEKYFQEIEGSVINGLMGGWRSEELAKDIQKRYSVSESRANLIARDQISKLNANLNEYRQTELGVTKYVWRTSNDERVRDSHKAKEGKIYSWNNPPSDTGAPGEDYQCVISGTKVHFTAPIFGAFKRRYTGPVVEITSKSERSITVTPNHPILTLRGWVPANELNSSDKLLESFDPEMLDFFYTDINDRSIRCQDIFDLFEVSFPTKRIDGSDIQFHRDGRVNEEVKVIRIPGILAFNKQPLVFKHLRKLLFPYSDFTSSAHVRESDLIKMIYRSFLEKYNLTFSFVRSELVPLRTIRFVPRSNKNISFNESSADKSASSFELLSQSKLAHSLFIESADLFNIDIYTVEGSRAFFKPIGINYIRHREYSGEVFNYQTDNGMYTANGLIVSNCRCYADPILESINSEEGAGSAEE